MANFFERLFSPPPPAVAPFSSFAEENFAASLPSRVAGGYFHGDFNVRWVSDSSLAPTNREWMRTVLIREARVCTEKTSVAAIEVTAADVNNRLRAITWPAEGNFRNPAITVQLTSTAEARQTAVEWEKLQARLALGKVNAELEVERLRHLREDIFTKPDVARTYWLDRHPEGLDGVLDDRFERVAERLGSSHGPSTMTVANLVRDFLSGLDAEQKKVMLDLLDRVFTSFDRPELSGRLPLDLP